MDIMDICVAKTAPEVIAQITRKQSLHCNSVDVHCTNQPAVLGCCYIGPAVRWGAGGSAPPRNFLPPKSRKIVDYGFFMRSLFMHGLYPFKEHPPIPLKEQPPSLSRPWLWGCCLEINE